MTTKNMSYDHPAYTSVHSLPTGNINGSAGASTKFCAYTGLIAKSVTLKPTTAGTSNDIVSFIQISGTTTTTQTGITTIGSGVTTFTNVPLNTASNGVSLSQGDTFYVVKGTDATGTYIGSVELVVQPGANVTQ